MSNPSFQGNRFTHNLSSYLIMGFAIVILIAASFSEIFQSSQTSQNLTALYNNPFNKDFIKDVSSIQFQSDIAQVELEKDARWRMTSPRQLRADDVLVQKILNTLGTIVIKKVYQKEPINLKSFSLDRPRAKLMLKSQERQYNIHFGLINSIDNSTYISIEEFDSIYQIANLSENITNYDIAAFLDARVFPFSANKISSLKIFKRNIRSPHLHFLYKEEQWVDQRGRVLSKEKVEEFLSNLSSVESMAILDKQSEKNQKIIDRYRQRHQYRVEIEHQDGNVEAYTITSLIKNLPDISFENYTAFAVIPEEQEREFPRLVQKKHFWPLSLKTQKFRNLSLKKIIY